MNFFFYFTLLLSLFSTFCTNTEKHKPPKKTEISLQQKFYRYWMNGQAEISSYKLEQSRYQEIRSNNANKVLIFVVEPFSLSKQVKADPPYNFENDTISVLKLNQIDRFVTGIYDYSIMTSIFTSIQKKDIGETLKLTFSTQDWCGQGFVQINKHNKKNILRQFSYFMSEGDLKKTLPINLILEESLLNQIRIDPNLLPIGLINILPSQKILRLDHLENKSYKATTSIHISREITSIKEFQNKLINTYAIQYSMLKRRTLIHYQNIFPYLIEGIEEQVLDEKQKPIQKLSTIATRIKTIMIDYWNKHSINDEKLRKQLNL